MNKQYERHRLGAAWLKLCFKHSKTILHLIVIELYWRAEFDDKNGLFNLNLRRALNVNYWRDGYWTWNISSNGNV